MSDGRTSAKYVIDFIYLRWVELSLMIALPCHMINKDLWLRGNCRNIAFLLWSTAEVIQVIRSSKVPGFNSSINCFIV